jgi:hypothetical protein
MTVEVLQQCGGHLTRENSLNVVTHMEDATVPPGVTLNPGLFPKRPDAGSYRRQRRGEAATDRPREGTAVAPEAVRAT